MNLLTPTLRRDARIQLALATIRSLAGILLVYGAAAATALTVGHLLLQFHFRTVVVRQNLVLRREHEIAQVVRATNELVRGLGTFPQEFTPWSVALAGIGDRLPPGITLSKASVIRATELRLEGRAATREDLLALDAMLRQDLPFLTDALIPFSHFLQRERIDFSADARVRREAVWPARAAP